MTAQRERSRLRLVPDGAAAPDEAPATVEVALGTNLDALYATARFLCGNAADAEDLVQDTALAAYRAWGELRDARAAKAWLMRILYRKCLNTGRQRRRQPPLVDVDIDTLLAHPILGVEPQVPIIDDALSDDVREALDALPEGFAEVVWLVDVHELTLAEAADVLQVPVGTAASRVHRARRLLRDSLASGRKV
jgi:RNA polymerase sigma-70 factor (ECF subfamily)